MTMKICLIVTAAVVCIMGVMGVDSALAIQHGNSAMIDLEGVSRRIRSHLTQLTVAIGERSVRTPENLNRAAAYIESFYQDIGMTVRRQSYDYEGMTVANIVGRVSLGSKPKSHYLIGAHYDSVMGTVGADDNASAVAVQLETARLLNALAEGQGFNLSVTFVSFALEEPPAYGTRFMGSRVYAKEARRRNEKIDGMICLEMVGYACDEPNCQDYPFPLMFFGYPKKGNFIGIVSNTHSKPFARSLAKEFRKNSELPVVKLAVPLNGRILPAVRLSDHASFWDQGFRAVMVTDTAFYRNPYYHTAFDTMDKLDYGFMAELVESLVRFLLSLKKN